MAAGEDKEIRLTLRKDPVKALPFAVVIAFVAWEGAVVFVAVMCFHHWVWNKIHLDRDRESTQVNHMRTEPAGIRHE